MLENKFSSMLKTGLCIVFLDLPHVQKSLGGYYHVYMYKTAPVLSTTKKVAQDGRADHRMKINVRKLH